MVEKTKEAVSVQQDLLAFTKIKTRDGESDEDFTRRVVKKVNDIVNAKEDKWNELQEASQIFCNEFTEDDEGRAEDEKVDKEPREFRGLLTVPEADASAKGQESKVVSKTKANGKKPAVAKKAAAPKAKAAKAAGAGRGRKGSLEPDAKIKVLAKENPKRKGSKAAKLFDKYKTGMTVAEALKAGIPWSDIHWNAKHEFISVS